MSKPRPHRSYTSWRRACVAALSFAAGTGWKHRVAMSRPGCYVVTRTDRRVDWGPPFAKPLGAIRMTIEIGGRP